MPPVPTGEKRERLVVLARSLEEPDAFGEKVQNWVASAVAYWASLESSGQVEQNSTPGMASARTLARFRVRGRVTIPATERMRWVNTGQDLEVTGSFFDGQDTLVDCFGVQGGGSTR